MFEYKSESLKMRNDWSGRINKKDLVALDELMNERSEDGWELFTYCQVTFQNTILITFRRQK